MLSIIYINEDDRRREYCSLKALRDCGLDRFFDESVCKILIKDCSVSCIEKRNEFFSAMSDSGFWFIADKLGSEQMVVCVHSSNIITKEGLEECMANLGPDASKPKTLFTNAKLDKSAKRFARKKDIEVIDRNQLLDGWL